MGNRVIIKGRIRNQLRKKDISFRYFKTSSLIHQKISRKAFFKEVYELASIFTQTQSSSRPFFENRQFNRYSWALEVIPQRHYECVVAAASAGGKSERNRQERMPALFQSFGNLSYHSATRRTHVLIKTLGRHFLWYLHRPKSKWGMSKWFLSFLTLKL